jgi:hypothetical protein
MPFMGGIESTSIIRKYEEENALERIPIVGEYIARFSFSFVIGTVWLTTLLLQH